MKKLLALLLTLAMLFSLAACGGGSDDKTPSSDDKTPSSSQQQEDKTPEADPVEDEPEDKGGEDGFVWPDNVGSIPNPEWGEPFHYGFTEWGAPVHTMFYNGVTQDQAKAYAELLISDHGFEFEYDPDESDGYFASLHDGTYRVTVQWTTENCELAITLPD